MKVKDVEKIIQQIPNVEDGTFGPCYICLKKFGRIRLTDRYCHQCDNWYCEGEHGTFAGMSHCLICDTELENLKK